MSSSTKFITKSSSYRDVLHALWLLANKPVGWNINETDFSREQFSKWDKDFKTKFEKEICAYLGITLSHDDVETGNYALEIPHKCECHKFESITENIHEIMSDIE